MGIYNTLENTANTISTTGIVLIIIMSIFALAIFLVQGYFLNKYNKYMTGKNTWQAWVPIANLYLLGRLTFNEFVGWALVVFLFFRPDFLTVPYNFAVIGLYIYAIAKFISFKSEERQDATPSMIIEGHEKKSFQEKKEEEKEKLEKETIVDKTAGKLINNITDKVKETFKDKIQVKNKETEEKVTQEYQSQQPMHAPTETEEDHTAFDPRKKVDRSTTTDSLQSFYSKK